VQVARLAGLPRSVLQRAEELLRVFEAEDDGAATRGLPHRAVAAPSPQLSLFQPVAAAEEQVIEALRAADLERLSPLDALNLLWELRRKL